MLERIDSWTENLGHPSQRKKGFLVFLAVLAIMTLLLYLPYVTGEKALIFVDVGSDSFAQSVPFFLNASSRFSSGTFSTWNPSQYLGTTTYESWNPEYLVSLFGSEGVLWGMTWCQVIKMMLAGVFCYLYTGWLTKTWKTRFIVSLGYAACGRMLAIAAWTAYTMEVTVAMMMLWSFERFFHDRRKFVTLPISIGLMVAFLNVYGLVLYTAVFFAYSLCRICYEKKIPDGRRLVRVFVLQLVLLWAAGVLLALPELLPLVRAYLNSPRVSSNVGAGQGGVLAIVAGLFSEVTDPTILGVEVMNAFTTGGFGYMGHYLSPINCLNSPYFYCGLLTIVSAPLSLVNKTRRQRAWIIVPAAFALMYCLFPNLRYLMNGFGVGADDFRMSSFFVVLVLVYLGTLGMESLWHQAKRWQIAAVFLLALGMLAGATLMFYPNVARRAIAIAGAFLLGYAAILLLSRKPGLASASTILVVAVPIELFLASFGVINNVTITITPEYYRSSFYDTSVDALSDAGEDVGEQRIDDEGGLLTSSMAGSFLSTKMYIGGAGINRWATDFLKYVGNDYVESSGYSRYAYGIHSNELNNLLGVGYLAIPNNHDGIEPAAPYGYESIDYDGNWCLYKNDYTLPMMYGYTESEAMSRSDFLSISRDDRPAAMLRNIVLPDELAGQDSVTTAPYQSAADAPLTALASTDQTLTPEDVINLDLPSEGRSGYLVFDMDLTATSTESGNLYVNVPLYAHDGDEKPLSQARYRTAAGNEHIRIVVKDEGYEHACVTISDVNNTPDPEVSNIRVFSAGEDYFDGYREGYEARVSSNPTVSDYGNDFIEGSINLAEDGYVTVPFSFDGSWHAYVDGTEEPVFVANLGFVGVKVPAGSHAVRFEYHDQLFSIGLLCAGITAAALVASRVALQLRGHGGSEETTSVKRHHKPSHLR